MGSRQQPLQDLGRRRRELGRALWLAKGPGRKLAPAIGIVLDDKIKNRQTIFRSPTTPGALAVEVHSVRTALRRTARGGTVSDLVVEITQRRRGYFDAEQQAAMDKGP